jgi:hypothetical protein
MILRHLYVRVPEDAGAIMVFDKLVRRCLMGDNGRAEAGPYRTIRPAEAGAGCYRCPAYKLPDEKVKDHNRAPFARSRRNMTGNELPFLSQYMHVFHASFPRHCLA